MRAVPYKSALHGISAPYQYSFYSFHSPYASLPAMASAQKIPASPAVPRLPAEPTKDAPTYMISRNHGLTAHVGYWNSQPLLQLRARAQDCNSAPRAILVTLELAELDALERDIGRAEALLNEHNTRTHAAPAQLLFRQLSTLDSGRLRHLEVSRWQGYVRASVRRFFINPQGDLYPRKDGIQYNADQLAILRRLFPLIPRDFATAARNADQIGACEQETMDLILAHERELQADFARQRDPRLQGRDEVDSHAAGAAPARNGPAEMASSVALGPSTSASGGGGPDIVSIMPVTPDEGTPVPKLKRKKTTKRGPKKAKPLLPDSEPERMVIDHVTIKHNPHRRLDPSPPIGGSDPAPVIMNIDSDSDNTQEL